MNSRMMAWASFLIRGGKFPSTITLFSLYRRDRMSSIRISYGVNSYSIGGPGEKSTFLSFTPCRSSRITWTQRRAWKYTRKVHISCLNEKWMKRSVIKNQGSFLHISQLIISLEYVLTEIYSANQPLFANHVNNITQMWARNVRNWIASSQEMNHKQSRLWFILSSESSKYSLIPQIEEKN